MYQFKYKVDFAGDKDLANFLADEISMEKEHQKADELPKIKGFEVSKVDGSEITLTRKIDTETFVLSRKRYVLPRNCSQAHYWPRMLSLIHFAISVSTCSVLITFNVNDTVEDIGDLGGESQEQQDVDQGPEVTLNWYSHSACSVGRFRGGRLPLKKVAIPSQKTSPPPSWHALKACTCFPQPAGCPPQKT